MVQLQLSSALDKGRNHQHKVVCAQRTSLGLFFGTIQETEDGYMGHLLSPKHPLLPLQPGSSRLGFLHSNRDEAYEQLALQVAKAAWRGTLGFEPTCLDHCSQTTRDAFVSWLLDQICDSRAAAAHGQHTDGEQQRVAAVRIRPQVVKERADMIARDFINAQNATGRMQ